jgi:hypothetical protein
LAQSIQSSTVSGGFETSGGAPAYKWAEVLAVALFIRLTVLAAIVIVALVVLAFVLKALIVGALVAALIVAGVFVTGFFRRFTSRPGPLVRR